MSLIIMEKLEKKVEQDGSALSTISREVSVLGSKVNSLNNSPLLHSAEAITLSQQRRSPDSRLSVQPELHVGHI